MLLRTYIAAGWYHVSVDTSVPTHPWYQPAAPYVCNTRSCNTTLVDFQLDAQNSYFFICNTFIKILYMFRALPCSSSGGLRRNCVYAASGIVTLCRWLSCAPVEKELQCQHSHDTSWQRHTCVILEAVIQFRCSWWWAKTIAGNM